jgi:hypothetical protein
MQRIMKNLMIAAIALFVSVPSFASQVSCGQIVNLQANAFLSGLDIEDPTIEEIKQSGHVYEVIYYYNEECIGGLTIRVKPVGINTCRVISIQDHEGDCG